MNMQVMVAKIAITNTAKKRAKLDRLYSILYAAAEMGER